MNIQNNIIPTTSLEESLRTKGAIKGSVIIKHEELIKDKKLFHSLTHREIDYLKYLRIKKGIAETYQKSNSWDKALTINVYKETFEGNEPFLDYIEEFYKTKVKDAKHLQKLTGITVETLEGLEDILFKAKYCRYFKTIETAIDEGAKYKDLLQIKPKDYGLPETWEGQLSKDQYTAILWAIVFEFRIEPKSLMFSPSLRVLAEELDAPYSVIMDAYKLMR